MANKLKNMLLKSVDLVRRGANPDADIKFYKSIDGEPENMQVIMKSGEEIQDMIEKSEDLITDYAEILTKSFTSIVNDDSIPADVAREMMAKSLTEFNMTVFDDIIKGFSYAQNEPESEGNEMRYSELVKSAALNDGERSELANLLEKACGKKVDKAEDPEIVIEEDDEEYGEEPPYKPTEEGAGEMRKSYEAIIQQQNKQIEALQKRFEMNDLVKLAKKYEPIGENAEELAKTLYDMKSAGEDIYKSYVSNLDKTLELYQKSGMFGEIGKSYGAPVVGTFAKSGIEAQIDNFAEGIMKADPTMNRTQAIAKAWEDHPELAIEYETSRR